MTLEDRLSRGYAPAWRPEQPGETLMGEVLEYSTAASQFGACPVVTVVDENGEAHSVWLLTAVLRSQFGKARPKIGERIGIRFLGRRISASGMEYSDWRVEVDRDPADELPDFNSWAGCDVDAAP